MADNHKSETEEGYELDPDDTMSAWNQVVEEAVAAVDKTGAQDEGARDDAPAPATGDEAEGSAAAAVAEEGEAELDESSEVRSLREQLVRTLADFDNYRKRTDREKAQMQRYALFDVLKDFLDVSDNLERALAASGSTDDLKTGVEMIARQFSDLLRRYGVERIDAVGKPFDPTVHEAVAREESSEVDAPAVTAELQRGYRLHDRLLRPAMVIVAMPVAEASATEEEAPSAENRARDDGEAVGEAVGQATEAN